MAIVFYKDLPLDFTPHPVTGDIRAITDETAIRRSIANIIKTPKGSRPFRPDYGTDIKRYLFNNSIFSEYEVNQKIYEAISRFEPRVTVISVTTKLDNNELKIDTNFIIKNTGKTTTFQTLVKRAA
jgi:phage baseplate assembly protein W